MSQNTQILKYLRPPGRTLTPLKALQLFGCLRLSARIHNLRNEGHPIQMKYETKGAKTYAKYFMA